MGVPDSETNELTDAENPGWQRSGVQTLEYPETPFCAPAEEPFPMAQQTI